MDIKLYLECEDSNVSSKEYDNYYDENSYVKALEESYNQTKDVIYESMNNGFTDVLRQHNNSFNTFNLFNNKSSQIEDKHHYCTCDARLYKENGDEETLIDFIKKSFDNDVSIYVFNINLDGVDEEFETEFKMWLRTHNKISSLDASDEWKMSNEPKMDIKIKFKNNIGTDSFGLLHNCRMLDKIDDLGYAILIERISFINDID